MKAGLLFMGLTRLAPHARMRYGDCSENKPSGRKLTTRDKQRSSRSALLSRRYLRWAVIDDKAELQIFNLDALERTLTIKNTHPLTYVCPLVPGRTLDHYVCERLCLLALSQTPNGVFFLHMSARSMSKMKFVKGFHVFLCCINSPPY